jgi:hypothetical protein
MSLLHPSSKRLEGWLESGVTDAGLETHVENCTRCSDAIETLADDVSGLLPALQAILQPAPGLEDRMENRIRAAMLAREDLRLMLRIFGSGAETARILFEPPAGP